MQKITTKLIKETYACSCGFNVADEYHAQLKCKTLRAMGAKRKRCKTTGATFYHIHYNANCNGHAN